SAATKSPKKTTPPKSSQQIVPLVASEISSGDWNHDNRGIARHYALGRHDTWPDNRLRRS
ncbi:MAG: hypothetical protein ACXWXT_08880, partial [Candidatus Binatia bacterium]